MKKGNESEERKDKVIKRETEEKELKKRKYIKKVKRESESEKEKVKQRKWEIERKLKNARGMRYRKEESARKIGWVSEHTSEWLSVGLSEL